jgi:hypothetical protein
VVRLVAFVLSALLAGAPASLAAEITSLDIGDAGKLIFIDGDIESGDLDRFLSAAGATDRAAVLLRSPGGDLREGLRIAKAIRLARFNTGVAPDFVCASACALIWLSGTTRYMAPTSLIGFHAAYRMTELGAQESGAGNALIGAFMNEIGLPEEAILFATTAGPSELNLLTIEAAQRVGIPTVLLEVEESTIATPVTPAQPVSFQLKLPTGFRWLVLQSRASPTELEVAKYAPLFPRPYLVSVQTKNGQYALAAGPFERTVADNFQRQFSESGEIPADTYLSSGNGFVSLLD